MPDATRAFAMVLADELARQGVTDIVVAPGARSTPIVLAVAEHPAIRVHVRIDERSASFLALGIAKASERPAAVVCTSGTAAAQFHAAVLEADQAGVPLLALTADRPPELRGVGASQTIDQVGMYGGAVRWALDVPVAELRPDSIRLWRSLVARAVAAAVGDAGAPPGPVHMNLPLREPLAPAVGDDTAAWLERQPVVDRDHGWAQAAIGARAVPDQLAELASASPRGVVVCGDGLRAVDALAAVGFAARAGWPVIAEPHSGARRGKQALRTADAVLGSAGFIADHPPDVAIVCGRVGLSRTVIRWLSTVPHVVVARLGRPDVTRSARAVLATDPAVLADLEPPSVDRAWLSDWLDAGTRAAGAVDGVLEESEQLTEPRVARDLAAQLPTNAALIAASSMPIRDLDLTMRPRDLRVLSNRGVSGIDGFVSTVQGVALSGDVAGPVVGLAGDLSLLHDVNGLLPGPDQRPDVTYVVVNNNGGGIFSVVPQGMDPGTEQFERLFATPHHVDLSRLAVAYDVEHVLLETASDLQAAVASVTAGVRILEVRTDRVANAALHQRMREAAAGAVAST